MQNQDSVHSLLRQAEADLGLCLIEASRTQEDPLQRQRLLVEEERLRYLNEEELIIQQLQWANPDEHICMLLFNISHHCFTIDLISITILRTDH